MNIILFGIPDLGSICLNELVINGKNVVAVVPPPPGHFAHEAMVKAAAVHNIPYVFFNKSPKEADFIEKLKAFNPNLFVVSAFDHLLPQAVIDIPKLGTINCHPSLLPEYRGGNPYFHVIINNEQVSGVTIHYMDSTFDTGDIILQTSVPIYTDETIGTIYNRSNGISAKLLLETVTRIENGEKIIPIPQENRNNLKSAPKVHPERGDLLIDWTKDAEYIERFIRALNPFFGADFIYKNSVIKIWKAKFEKKRSNVQPGTVLSITEDNFGVATGNGIIYPTCLQVSTQIITDGGDFAKRIGLKIGEIFNNKFSN